MNILVGEKYQLSDGKTYLIMQKGKDYRSKEQMLVFCPVTDASQVFVCKQEEFEQAMGTEDKECDSKAEVVTPVNEEELIDPILFSFLEAESIREKIMIVEKNEEVLDEHLITSMSISEDIVLNEEKIENMIEEFLTCLKMKLRYEDNRFR